MLNNVGFFTAVKYELKNKNLKESFLEKVDNYFYLGGKKAHVIQQETNNGQKQAVLAETNSSLLARFGKILSYFTIILPLTMLITKAILRSTHTFRLIDPKKQLEKGINISEDTLSKIQSLISQITFAKKDDGIEWLSTGNNFVFKLKENPQLVFKKSKRNDMHKRFENMIKAKEVCLVNHLGLLIIPQAKKFMIDRDCFIAEEALDFNPKESFQESLYQTCASELNETARQLATFIAKTGFNDVTWRNIPILNEIEQYKGPRRVGLIDVEDMKSKVNGFIGDNNGSCGLIGCVSEEQIDIVISEARKQGLPISDKQAQYSKKQRLENLHSDKGLKQFYEKHVVKKGDELIKINENVLCFSEYPAKAEVLKALAIEVIKEINDSVIKSSPGDSVKGRRYICININLTDKPFFGTVRLIDEHRSSNSYKTDEEYYNATYLGCVVKKLVDLDIIFNLIKRNGHGCFLQA